MVTATRGRSIAKPKAGRLDRTRRLLVDLRRISLIVGGLLLTLVLLGSSVLPATDQVSRDYATAVHGWGFDLLSWEVDALRAKVAAAVQQPVSNVSQSEQPRIVREYLERARQMQRIEGEIQRLLAIGTSGVAADSHGVTSEIDALQIEQDELRSKQQSIRPTVEQIIQNQVGWVLSDEGFALFGRPLPPVQFTFTEPPKKLVVSPRDRIDTVFSRMLSAEISLSDIEAAEDEISKSGDASAYITNIGGLGAFPTMVVDRAGLEWVLSTVAHESAHNYLVFTPLGWNYFTSHDMTTMNETAAEIIGNEIGERTYQLYYAEPATAPPTPQATENTQADETQSLEVEALPFDFRAEMRTTRLEVDRLLAEGKVDAAEAYMEERRQQFVEQGYPLRVLNQAYFAFHGSYGTSAASTNPIGPKMEKLRELMPNLQTFLQTVRGFTSVDDLDSALAEWEDRNGE